VTFYGPKHNGRPWQPISTAPCDKDVEVQASDGFGSYSLTFPVRLTDDGWINAKSRSLLAVEPTHWRERKAYR
jgi:hypothetical protein